VRLEEEPVRLEELVEHCLAKPGAEETHPCGEAELVAKVGGKAFAFIGMAGDSVGVKCGSTAADAAEYRERYPDDVTISGYIGRYGWNSVRYTEAVPAGEVRELIDRSYAAVVAKLPKSRRPV
jgi:predicted DNA-binding protein (MmcQ/YjbR family)